MENCKMKFPVIGANGRAAILVDEMDFKGVRIAAQSLAGDITLVTGKPADVLADVSKDVSNTVILAGTMRNAWIAELVDKGVVDIGKIAGKWECYHMQVVENPGYGIACALVIVGSDKRGAIYGIYKVSELLGVSPWVWWADSVPVKQEAPVLEIAATDSKEPSVRYRGFFINDENPCFLNWCTRKFGGVNSKAYVKVFELLLRLKGNYLWPAMWGKSFNADDPACPALADDYGVVMGTSHHEPMMRAQKEWTDLGDTYGGHANWNYAKNKEGLYRFWEDRIKANKDYEKIITVGMRGDGDEEMIANGRPEECVALLEKIVADQREIIAKHINPDPSKVPQVWCLYKEVEAFYYAGLKVPDDITLMLCDDNFGNVRMLPTEQMRKHSGGFGMYYHFDYVGGPHSYKWINNMPLAKTWEQMSMAYDYGVRQIWIVNVGDLKPMELPLTYFLDLAYDFDTWGQPNRTEEYLRRFVEREFGGFYRPNAELSEELWKNYIYGALHGYTHLNGIRKPEGLRQNTFSLTNFREADRMLEDYEGALMLAELADGAMAEEKKDAYYQLVLHPVKASCIMYRLLISAAKCNYYAGLGSSLWRKYKTLAERAFADDAAETEYYNHVLAGGKWDGMMDQAHIGQTMWQSVDENIMPELAECELSEQGGLLVTVSQDAKGYRGGEASLPLFSEAVELRRTHALRESGADEAEQPEKVCYEIRLLNTGRVPYACRIQAEDGLLLTRKAEFGCLMYEKPVNIGELLSVEDEVLLTVRVDFAKAKNAAEHIVITQVAQESSGSTDGASSGNREGVSGSGSRDDADGAQSLKGAGKEENTTEQVIAQVAVRVPVFSKITAPECGELFAAAEKGAFTDEAGYIAFAAAEYAQLEDKDGAGYIRLWNYGREEASIKSVNLEALEEHAAEDGEVLLSLRCGRTPGVDAPSADYPIYLKEASDVAVTLFAAPTNQLSNDTGMRYAVAIDDGEIVHADTFPKGTPVGFGPVWERGVMDNIHRAATLHKNIPAGAHTLRFYMEDDGLVLQKFLLETCGTAPESNLGPV